MKVLVFIGFLALEGAICGVKKTLLSDERKAELKEFYNKNKINI